jgi:G:T-mismatch repair DNA endonuclease (very short patch repair protein)
LYEGFESEQVFHGFVPDEINHEIKVIIEVFGDLYHCNPKKYKNPDVFISATKRTVGQQWARDKIKLDAYKEYGYTTIVVWESDIRKRLSEQLTRIKLILKEKEEAYGLPPYF